VAACSIASAVLVASHALPAAAGSMLDTTGRFALHWWTVDDGLPEVPVTGLGFAPDGTLWCATPSRIARFDGREFDPLPVDLTKPLHEVLDTFWSLGFDGDGRLWVQGSRGVAQLQEATAHQPRRWRVHTLRHGSITSLTFSARGGPVLVGPGVVLQFDGNRFVDVTPRGLDPKDRVWRYGGIDRSRNELWLWGGDAGTRRMFHGLLPARGAASVEEDVSPVASSVITMAFGPCGVAALLPDAIALHHDPGWETVATPVGDTSDRSSGKLAFAPNGALWVSSHAGLLHYLDQQIVPASTGLPAFSFFTRQFIADAHGGAWAACASGLLAVQPTQVVLEKLRDCRAACVRADGSVLAAAPGGIFALPAVDAATGSSRPTLVAPLPDAAIPTALVEDDQGRVWVGTRDSFLLRLENGQLRQVTRPGWYSQELRAIEWLVRDTAGRIWAGTSNGLAWHDAERDQFTRVVEHQGPPGPVVIGLAADGDAGVLAATATGGVTRYTSEGPTRRVLSAAELPGRRMLVLYRDAEGTIWVGGDRGLVRVAVDGTVFRLTTATGLVDDSIRQIEEDGLGRLWVATRSGHLQGMRTSDLNALAVGAISVVRGIVLGPLDGMGDHECVGRVQSRPALTAHAEAASGGGRLVVPLSEGIVRLDPADLGVSSGSRPQVRFETAAGNRIHFAVTPSGVWPSAAPLYQTMLEGVDAGWSPPGPETSRDYVAVPPGEHRFRVRRVEGETDADFPTTSTVVRVPVPWWRSPWGITAMVMAASAAAWGVARTIARRRIVQLERQREMDRERARIARDIHDSLGAGLTRMALMSDLARRGERPSAELRERLDAIWRDARALTRSVDEIVWAVNPGNDTTSRFLSYVVHDVEEFARAGELSLRLDVPDQLDEELPVPAGVRHHVCLAVRELLQNVLRHARATHVDFRIAIDRSALVVEVADDGVGISTPADVAAGQDGLANIRGRIGELGGSFSIDSTPRAGTRAVIRVPLARGGPMPLVGAASEGVVHGP